MKSVALSTMNIAPTEERVALLDVLRGLALVGILVVNMEYYSQTVYDGWAQPELRGWADLTARWFVIAFFQLKSYLLFALLFGYGIGMGLQSGGQSDTAAVKASHLRRMLFLAVVGVVHATLLFSGDILVTYAILGVISIAFWRASTAHLLTWSIAMFVVGIGVGISLIVLLPVDMASGIDIGGIRDIYAQGTALQVIVQRIADVAVAFPFIFVVQGPMVFVMLLLGIAMARHGVLTAPDRHVHLLRCTTRWGLTLGLMGSAVAATLSIASSDEDLATAAGFLLQLLSAPAVCLGVVTWVAMLQVKRRLGLLASIRAPGRMSLTIYLAESLVCALIFTSYGLGLFAQVGPATCLAISAGVAGFLTLFSRCWFKRYRFGPLEWLLRSGTYWRWQPLRRQANKSVGIDSSCYKGDPHEDTRL
ncbi:MAG: DUF418 domain-containing protein [Pseudomonadales bacterium]